MAIGPWKKRLSKPKIPWAPNDGTLSFGNIQLGNEALEDKPLRVSELNSMNAETDRGSLKLESAGDDPSISFTLGGIKDQSAVVWFDMDVFAGLESRPVVFLDFGQGFSEHTKFSLILRNGVWFHFIPNAEGLQKIRMDPAESDCSVILRRAGVTVTLDVHPPVSFSSGLHVRGMRDLEFSHDGTITPSGSSPQIQFDLPNTARTALCVSVLLQLSAANAEALDPKLYFGPEETDSLLLQRDDSNEFGAKLFLPNLLGPFRLDFPFALTPFRIER
ncbi:MAG TPA: hypothetical protein VF511_05700, partial [Chthoniobacterales bacterium]